MKRFWLMVTVVLLASSQAYGVPISLFADVETYLERAKEIVIVQCVSIPEEGTETFVDGFFPANLEAVMTLKGERKPGPLTVATIYDMKPKQKYLLANSGGQAFGTDFLALAELSVIPMAANFDLEKLKGKELKQQVQMIMARYLFDIEEKLAPLRHTEGLLRKALQDRRDNVYKSAGKVRFDKVQELQTKKTGSTVYLEFSAGHMEWSHAAPGQSGYLYFRSHGTQAAEWEFAASDLRNLQDFSDEPLEVKFYGQFSPSLDHRLGHESSNAINVKVGQIVLARTVKDPATIYILRVKQQQKAESLTVEYAVLPGE